MQSLLISQILWPSFYEWLKVSKIIYCFSQIHVNLLICIFQDVCKLFAYGEYTANMPDRPAVPAGSTYNCVMGIPAAKSSKAKIHWFLFSSENELQ